MRRIVVNHSHSTKCNTAALQDDTSEGYLRKRLNIWDNSCRPGLEFTGLLTSLHNQTGESYEDKQGKQLKIFGRVNEHTSNLPAR
jgi:hypothetical protein